MAVLAWKFPRTRLPMGASALCVVVLCWLYIFPVYRLPNEKEIVQGVLQQGTAWRRNQTAARAFRISAEGAVLWPEKFYGRQQSPAINQLISIIYSTTFPECLPCTS